MRKTKKPTVKQPEPAVPAEIHDIKPVKHPPLEEHQKFQWQLGFYPIKKSFNPDKPVSAKIW